jgi:squalene cyclase
VTAFALRALRLGNVEPKQPRRALEFLVDSQTEEGHWGQEWAYYGTPFYAMAPILDVLSHYDRYGDVIERSRRYIVRSQLEDGRWYAELPDFPRSTSAELQTALALQCCFDAELDRDDETVRKGTRWLMGEQNPDGSWHGGFFPNRRHEKSEDIYATSQTLVALARYDRM